MKYWSISSQVIVNEAKRRGYKVEIINKNKNFFLIQSKNKHVLFKNIDCGLNSSIGLKICNDKELTYDVLNKIGIKIPNTFYLENNNFNTQINFSNIEFPVIVKPTDGAHGQGVTTNIVNKNQLLKAIKKAFLVSEEDRIIIQTYIKGEEFRLLVLGDKIIAGVQRIPPFVVGDGQLTIQQLIDEENKNSDRGKVMYEKSLNQILIDYELINFLENQNYDLDSILKKDLKIQLRGNSNVGTGGITKDVTDIISKEYFSMAKKISNYIGCELFAIDVVSSDISKGFSKTNSIILELNGTPSIFIHEFSAIGKNIQVSKKILDYLFIPK